MANEQVKQTERKVEVKTLDSRIRELEEELRLEKEAHEQTKVLMKQTTDQATKRYNTIVKVAQDTVTALAATQSAHNTLLVIFGLGEAEEKEK